MGLHSAVGRENPLNLRLETRQSGSEEKARAARSLLLSHATSRLRGSGSAEGQRQGLGLERLGEVIESAQPDGLDGPGNPALGGHDDHARMSRNGLVAKQIRPQTVGQVHVHQGEVEIRCTQGLASPGHRINRGHLGAPPFQTGHQMPSPKRLILEHQH